MRAMWREAARYEPSMAEDERERAARRLARALERSRGWARDVTKRERIG